MKNRFEKLRKKRRDGLIFSTKFLDNMLTSEFVCFAPWRQYISLERKYTKLFKRYQRETERYQREIKQLKTEI